MSASELIWVCQRIDQRQFAANHDGNVSLRLDSSRFLVTPTARGKGELKESDLLEINEEGQTLSGSGKVFSEWALHRAIYRSNPSVRCVVHAHPVFATAYGLQEKPFIVDYLPEALVSLGNEVPCVPMTAPQSKEQLHLVSTVAPKCVAFLVAGNGVFAHGHDLKTVYYRIELVEHLARIQNANQGIQGVKRIPPALRAELLQKHNAYIQSLGGANSVASLTSSAEGGTRVSDEALDLIVDRVVSALGFGPEARP